MSINDLLDSEVLIPAMLVVFVVVMIFAIPTGIAMSRKTNSSIYGDDEYETTNEEENARIIARRTNPHPLNQTVMVNTVVFELADGNRIELAIKDTDTYSLMVEGDCGTLKYQGKKFVEFERGSSNEA